jgi:hypothetical protein
MGLSRLYDGSVAISGACGSAQACLPGNGYMSWGTHPMRIGRVLILALAVSLGAACASPDEIRRPCCYEGDLTLAHLERVRFVLKDGSELPFDRVFVGFEPQLRDVPTPFPFQKIGISGLVYDVLSVVFPTYDANDNGILEEPEMTVLYLREGAVGMGFQVAHLVVEERVRALQTSAGEVGGLVTYVNAQRPGMSKEARALFDEIDHLAAQIRRRGVGAADQTFLGP